MSAHTFLQTATSVRQTLVRYRGAIALSLLSVVTALAAYRFASVPAVATPVISGSQVSHLDPAQHGVLDYVRAHSAVQNQPLDPAQQGVLDYVRAHALVQPLSTPAIALEPAQQSVMSYLRAHANVHGQPLEPAQQGVQDYLRVHTTVETRLLDPSQRGVMDYLRAHNS
jgi:hypothetical protein